MSYAQLFLPTCKGWLYLQKKACITISQGAGSITKSWTRTQTFKWGPEPTLHFQDGLGRSSVAKPPVASVVTRTSSGCQCPTGPNRLQGTLRILHSEHKPTHVVRSIWWTFSKASSTTFSQVGVIGVLAWAVQPQWIQVQTTATLKDITRWLKTIKNIQKITKSMKVGTAAKYAQAKR